MLSSEQSRFGFLARRGGGGGRRPGGGRPGGGPGGRPGGTGGRPGGPGGRPGGQDISEQIEKAIRGVLTRKLILDVQVIPRQIQDAVLAVLNGAGIDTSDANLKARILSILKEIIGDNIKGQELVDKITGDIQNGVRPIIQNMTP